MADSFTFSTGDGFLRRLAQRLREAPAAVHRDAEVRVKRAVEGLLEEQFQTATDPHGRPYKPPKDGHSPPMTRSGRLRRGLVVRVSSTPDGLRIAVDADVEYAKYLQRGTYKMDPRLIVPGAAVLARRWRDRILAAHAESVAAHYQGGALLR